MHHSLKTAPLKMRIPLFWRLFLSLLCTILLTSMASISVERWLNKRALSQRVELQIERLIIQRELLVDILKQGDLLTIKQKYQQDWRFMSQISIYDAQGTVLFPNFPKNSRMQQYRERYQAPTNATAYLDDPTPNHKIKNPTIINDMVIDIDNRPEMANTTVTLPNGQTVTLQIHPHIRFTDVAALQRSNFIVRIILIILFGTLVCFWLSRTLIRRIRHVQDSVRQMIEGHYPSNPDITQLGTDELGLLAKDVAQLSSRLIDSELARKQMLSDISHELRSPLARLDVATELTRDFAPTATRYLDRIDKESARMNELIAQIIHIQSLQMQPYITDSTINEWVNLSHLISDIGQDVCFEFQNKPVNWQWQPPEATENWRIKGNAEQLHSALENVVRNAFMHTPAHATVTATLIKITTDDGHHAIQIDIKDEGDGVADKDLQRIFQPFVRLDSARQRQTGGYGLGLAIVHAVVMAHKGQIQAYNRDDGTKGLRLQLIFQL